MCIPLEYVVGNIFTKLFQIIDNNAFYNDLNINWSLQPFVVFSKNVHLMN